jgi:non-homologous end joining protein Ku
MKNPTTEELDRQILDTYAKDLERLIEARSKGQRIIVNEEDESQEETTDILEALKSSLKMKNSKHFQQSDESLVSWWI